MHSPDRADPENKTSGPHEQLELLRAEVRKAVAAKEPDGAATELAAHLPVARVVVDVDPSHLDRLWDYSVPRVLDQDAQAGVRVRVRFNGQLTNGYLWDRIERSEFTGVLTPLRTVISAEQVLSPQIGAVARAVADAYAGTLMDVLRVAIPPRHAVTEKRAVPDPAESADPAGSAAPTAPTAPALGRVLAAEVDRELWTPYEGGGALLDALADGQRPRAVWTALPGLDWAGPLAAAAHATLAGGRGAIVLVPDGRDVDRVDQALTDAFGRADLHVALTADLGPAERYRRWLALLRGQVRCVVGTRAAVYAPVADLGLIAMWDDGDPGYAERVAPYPHAREVLTLRAHREHAAALIGGHNVTAEGAQLIARRWARPVAALRAKVTEHRAVVRTAESDHGRDAAAVAARLPSTAWRAAREGLLRGPVLVQTPRAGYLPSIACVRCREPAVCVHCRGPLELNARNESAVCKWCAKPAGNWQCPRCASTRFRARAIGVARGAEELGRAFPGVPVLVSSAAGKILRTVGSKPALVVATPGSEPVAKDGYAVVLLLDGDLLLGLPNLRAGEQALRRWLAAAALARPASRDGQVIIAAEPSSMATQALLRWDPAGFARRELADRAELGYPPAARLAELTGTYSGVTELLALAELPEKAEVLGPNELPEPAPDGEGKLHRALVRVASADGRLLAAGLKAAQGVRTARSAPDFVRVRIDPVDLA